MSAEPEFARWSRAVVDGFTVYQRPATASAGVG